MRHEKYSGHFIEDVAHSLSVHSDEPAFVIGEETYSYSFLASAVKDIMGILGHVRCGIVGIVAEDSIWTYASALAVLISGKTYVVLHPSYPDRRNHEIASQSGMDIVLGCGESRICIPYVKYVDVSAGGSSSDDAVPFEGIVRNPESIAYMIFTSGSTGRPKGVPISYGNLDAFYRAYSALGWDMKPGDRSLQMFEMTFDVSVVSYLYPLSCGACVYTVGGGSMKYLKVFDILETHSLTHATVAPSVLRLFSSYFDEIHLPALRHLAVTAEAADVNLLHSFRRCAPDARFINLYGPSECTIYCTSYVIPENTADVRHRNGMVAIGKPFDGLSAYVADEDGNPVGACGTEGELLVSGAQVMSGYWKDPEKTESAFFRCSDGRLFYRTGDRCLVGEDGTIVYCGRMDSQVKIQGFRVELSEIEYNAREFFRNVHSEERNAVAFLDSSSVLYLAVEGKTAGTDDAAENLEEYLRGRMPHYMIPRHIVCLETFPLNASSKVDRLKIREAVSEMCGGC